MVQSKFGSLKEVIKTFKIVFDIFCFNDDKMWDKSLWVGYANAW